MWPQFRKILYATNLGPESPYVFRYALSIAQQYNAEIIILHVLEPLNETVKGMVEFFITDEQFSQHREKARTYHMERLRKRLAAFCDQETCKLAADVPDPVKQILVEEGPPAELILSRAKENNADLIIMGTHRKAREGGSRLLGSTARTVVNSAKIPVLTIYTPKDKFEDLESEEVTGQ